MQETLTIFSFTTKETCKNIVQLLQQLGETLTALSRFEHEARKQNGKPLPLIRIRIPEKFIWHIFFTLTKMAMAMERGKIESKDEDWEIRHGELIDCDLKENNGMFGAAIAIIIMNYELTHIYSIFASQES